MGASSSDLSTRGSRERFVRAAAAFGAAGVVVLAAILAFGTVQRHHGGACSYEVVSRAPIWMWLAGLTSLAIANAALTYARGIWVHDTQANSVLAWVLGTAFLAAVVWFAWAQWGYHQVSCVY